MALFGLFKKTQPIVAIEVLPERIRALKAKVDIESGKISLVDYISESHEFSYESLDMFADAVKGVLARLKPSKKQLILLGFHDGAAVTTRMNASVNRSNVDTMLRENELEDLIFKAQWKIFDKMRPVLAVKMGIGDLDLHLTDAKIEGVRLDGHRVINPIGFRPRTIEFDIINTFASKKMIRSLKQLIHEYGTLELVVERNAAFINALMRIYKMFDAVVITVRSQSTQIVVVKNRAIVYNQDFGWGCESLHNAMDRFFSVGAGVGAKIYDRYATGNLSDAVSKKIEHVFDDELNLFFQGVHLALSSLEKGSLPPALLFQYEEKMPDYVAGEIMKHVFPRGLFAEKPRMIVLPLDLIAEELKLSMPIENSFAALLAEFVYGEKGDSQLNNLLNKRVRWLEA